MNASGTLLTVENLTKRFSGRSLLGGKRGAVQAVRGVSFSVERNSVFGLVGESGSGKTTLARVLLHLEQRSGGKILFDGIDPGDLKPSALRKWRRRMQIVFQDPNSALNPRITVYRSLEEGLANLGLDAAERRRRIRELAEMVSVPFGSLTRHPHEFSGGQRQRIVIARALSMDPEFLVLDEPVSNLDVSIQAQIVNLLLDLKRKLSLTLLFISHDLRLVSYVSDTMAVMYRGGFVEIGPVDAVTERAGHPYTRRLFASIPVPAGTTPAGTAFGGMGPEAREPAWTEPLRGTEPYEMVRIGESHFVARH